MPKEYTLLQGKPEPPLKWCPNCGQAPFVSFMRGTVQRRKRTPFLQRPRPYCTVICSHRKEIIGWEDPITLKFERVTKYDAHNYAEARTLDPGFFGIVPPAIPEKLKVAEAATKKLIKDIEMTKVHKFPEDDHPELTAFINGDTFTPAPRPEPKPPEKPKKHDRSNRWEKIKSRRKK